jgi:hypothetical protein
MRTAVCIVGMHRSGTSAVARALNLLGLYLGEPESMMEAHPTDNPTGYWEVRSLEVLQQRLLLGAGIDDLSAEPLPRDWRDRQSTAEAAAGIREVVERLFGSRSLWGFKDPRTSILLPVWQEILGAMDFDMRYVIVLRNPLHVAASLGRRSGIEDTRAFQLTWHYYMLSALSHTRGAKRGFVCYQELLRDWRGALDRVIRQAAIPLNVGVDSEIARKIDDFLQPSLERSATASGDGWAAPFVAESYDLISTVIRDGESTRHDDRAQEMLDQYVNSAGRAMAICSARIREIESEARNLQEAISRAQSENALVRDEVDAMYASWSWKSTAPFRAAWELLKKWY